MLEIKNEINLNNYIEKVKEKNKGQVLKYSILTMGCQLNENDSEKMAGMLEKMGYNETEDYKNADIVIFNTCCVRENAEERLFGKVGEIKNIKHNKDMILAIGGCMMQEKNMVDKIKKSYPFVDIIFGTHTMQNLQEYIYKTIIEKQKVIPLTTIAALAKGAWQASSVCSLISDNPKLLDNDNFLSLATIISQAVDFMAAD